MNSQKSITEKLNFTKYPAKLILEKPEDEKSKKYCSHCYQDGEFIMPDITVEQMKDRVKLVLVEFGFPRFLTGLFTRNIHKLERWSK